ncbi:MAG: endonuclease III domain-containing protein [Deltaproteobacteria bacterium]|nr:endonuclease III domain-containing protein [Deltaproteobacteria bacterium]MBW2019798.1 endonuclease III domain-containing protein [Deltaproteobacteria bacterium]MBW2074603.1 endonuclease III domain-containing protein [Deltaproteobacteria bacterium]
MLDKKTILLELYNRLFEAFGPRHWWPGDSGFEVAVGAILTQNTAWRNVRKAIKNLKEKALLSPEALYHIPVERLASIIRPAGYYNIKARRLKHFVQFLFQENAGDLDRLLAEDLDTLRSKLLSINGIGPETADSILLYAGNRPTFVVDAYTRRILFRHNLIPEETSYDEVRNLFMDVLEPDASMFNEYHALLVHLGHTFCLKKNPKCTECPARGWNDA